MMTRLRRREPIHFRLEFARERERENRYEFALTIDDDDYHHSHNAGGHTFPCTHEQLRALQRQINETLGRALPAKT